MFEGDRYYDLDKLADARIAIDTDISPLPYRPEDFTVEDLFVKEIIKTGIRIV
ncbi:MAG: Nucleotidyltransferase protein [Ignavibacteria bacterium]|nr:Nucleotidyltransferase protein [Ignavibacteria bacterium]